MRLPMFRASKIDPDHEPPETGEGPPGVAGAPPAAGAAGAA
eukprot:CAMPEP_0175455000 /NCGR_PEP_ID=MMETSP0095-20121207/64789_1 /TAXON_ID=311494 /ORGANISM="Alexandrium monilatum, Strain CCMP3105" /LENGTH=40 /DNA_ID= /DNA_START= /DNA_END= /DNA_ORIENTATION=